MTGLILISLPNACFPQTLSEMEAQARFYLTIPDIGIGIGESEEHVEERLLEALRVLLHEVDVVWKRPVEVGVDLGHDLGVAGVDLGGHHPGVEVGVIGLHLAGAADHHPDLRV